ncbi:hypothetical protein BT96DRAFT_946341 [Gymnopus androsaceus JB14]|uniref:Uncharacterized protein n=1 Tax=Gymnopus androsaceus JB14 TaxID=1447944 RepID=A0A6A4GYM6_9AGAR|nr:hypothetical protein BT96DRAFT_946341 [Gymnopus androsaceus JB14]
MGKPVWRVKARDGGGSDFAGLLGVRGQMLRRWREDWRVVGMRDRWQIDDDARVLPPLGGLQHFAFAFRSRPPKFRTRSSPARGGTNYRFYVGPFRDPPADHRPAKLGRGDFRHLALPSPIRRFAGSSASPNNGESAFPANPLVNERRKRCLSLQMLFTRIRALTHFGVRCHRWIVTRFDHKVALGMSTLGLRDAAGRWRSCDGGEDELTAVSSPCPTCLHRCLLLGWRILISAWYSAPASRLRARIYYSAFRQKNAPEDTAGMQIRTAGRLKRFILILNPPTPSDMVPNPRTFTRGPDGRQMIGVADNVWEGKALKDPSNPGQQASLNVNFEDYKSHYTPLTQALPPLYWALRLQTPTTSSLCNSFVYADARRHRRDAKRRGNRQREKEERERREQKKGYFSAERSPLHLLKQQGRRMAERRAIAIRSWTWLVRASEDVNKLFGDIRKAVGTDEGRRWSMGLAAASFLLCLPPFLSATGALSVSDHFQSAFVAPSAVRLGPRRH